MTDTTPISIAYQVDLTPFAGDTLVMAHPQGSGPDYEKFRAEARCLLELKDSTITKDSAPELAEFAQQVLPKLAEDYVEKVWNYDPAQLGQCKITPWVVRWGNNQATPRQTSHYHLCVLLSLSHRDPTQPMWAEDIAVVSDDDLLPGDVLFVNPRLEQVEHFPKEIVAKNFDSQVVRPTEGLVCVFPSYVRPCMEPSPEETQLMVMAGIVFEVPEETPE